MSNEKIVSRVAERQPLDESAPSDDTRCTYAFRFCNARRAVKKSGELHKLCEDHRRRANETQTRSVERRKRKREAEERTRRMASAMVAPIPAGDPIRLRERTTDLSKVARCRVADEEDPVRIGSAAPQLNDEELDILQTLLFANVQDPN